MKKTAAALALSFVIAPAFAQKSCEELKQQIAAKVEGKGKGKGVKNAQLEIVAAEEVKDQKVVGSCEFGKKKITYKKA
jgi:hypothetical protein